MDINLESLTRETLISIIEDLSSNGGVDREQLESMREDIERLAAENERLAQQSGDTLYVVQTKEGSVHCLLAGCDADAIGDANVASAAYGFVVARILRASFDLDVDSMVIFEAK